MKMEHVTIHTRKLDESVNFYKTFCGLSVQAELKGDINIVFLANATGETCVELIENPDAKPVGDSISMGFHVDDVAAYHKMLEDKGMSPSPIISPNPKTRFFFVEDPNGFNIQFI